MDQAKDRGTLPRLDLMADLGGSTRRKIKKKKEKKGVTSNGSSERSWHPPMARSDGRSRRQQIWWRIYPVEDLVMDHESRRHAP